MTKLLDFKPNQNSNHPPKKEFSLNVANYIDEDIYFSCTPDLPTLRYEPVIKVFIMDELRTYKGLDTAIKGSDDMRVVNYTAQTKNSFVPVLNASNSDSMPWDFMVPPTTSWKNNFINFKALPSLPISGKVIEVTIDGIMDLDNYYRNTMLFRRFKIPVLDINGNEDSAFAYFVKTDRIFQYDPHNKVNVPVKNFRMAEPKTITKPNGHTLYAART